MQDGQFAELRANAFGARLGRLDVGHRENDDEFLASEPADDVFAANAPSSGKRWFRAARCLRHRGRSVVELLEVIEVKHRHTEQMLGPHRAADFAIQSLFQVAAIV